MSWRHSARTSADLGDDCGLQEATGRRSMPLSLQWSTSGQSLLLQVPQCVHQR